MSEPTTTNTYGPCVGLRKDGNPCRGFGIIFDPDLNGMVCEWHTGPQINQQHEIRLGGLARAGYEAVMRSLSNETLDTLIRDLRHFRNGKPLTRKAENMLHEILSAELQRQEAKKLARKHEVSR